MRHQRGVSLSGLLVWGAVIAAVALLGIRVAPDVIDYYKIKKIVASTAAKSSGKSVPEIRRILTITLMSIKSIRSLRRIWIFPRKATKWSSRSNTKSVSPCFSMSVC